MSANAVSSAKSSSNKVTSATSTGRPNLKNLTRARVPRAGIIGTSIAVIAAVSWKLFVSDRHKRDIAAFYKLVLLFFKIIHTLGKFSFQRTYDPERDYARMKAAGVFKSLGEFFVIADIFN